MSSTKQCRDCKGRCRRESRRCRSCYLKSRSVGPSRDAFNDGRPPPAMRRPGKLKTGSELLASLWNRRPGPDPPRPARYSP